MLTFDGYTPDIPKRRIEYGDGCQATLKGRPGYRHQTRDARGQRGAFQVLCASCSKQVLRATGSLPSCHQIPCAACGKSIGGSARVGPHGVICHACYDRSAEGQADIVAMREWWREHDLERRLPEYALVLTAEERRSLEDWREGHA